MRWGFVGFVVGIAVSLLALVYVQHRFIRDVDTEVSVQFQRYVFAGEKFPKADFEPGKMIHRFMMPCRLTTTFYDADYHEVKKAEKPGRYGAVVRLELSGKVVYRYVTLYRMPGDPYWWSNPWSLSVDLSPRFGIDPGVVHAQQGDIAEMLRSDFVGRGDGLPDLAVLLAGLAETPREAPASTANDNVVARDDAWWFGLRDKLGQAPKYRFLLDLPHDYDADPQKRWPLIVYLHSGAESGGDLRMVRRSGLPKEIAAGRQVPAIVVAPQRSDVESWSLPVLNRFLDDLAAKYRIDPDRIYLTGGAETWIMAAAEPKRIAAILPVGGGLSPTDAAALKDMPIWSFDSPEDEMTEPAVTARTLDDIRRAGGHPHATVIPGHGPDIWAEMYATEAAYTWLLAQKRGQAEVVTAGVP